MMKKPDFESTKMINGANYSSAGGPNPYMKSNNLDDMALNGVPYNYKSN